MGEGGKNLDDNWQIQWEKNREAGPDLPGFGIRLLAGQDLPHEAIIRSGRCRWPGLELLPGSTRRSLDLPDFAVVWPARSFDGFARHMPRLEN